MAGRKYNYDFQVLFMKNGEIVSEKYIEFKNNAKSITNLPQFLQVPENIGFIPQSYANYYYDYYLQNILEIDPKLAGIKPDKKEYLKMVWKTKYDIDPMFKALYNKDKLDDNFVDKKSDIVNESIKNFLNDYAKNIDIDHVAKKIKESQKNKIFLMWDCATTNFYKEILPEQARQLKFDRIKNNNTIVLSTRDGDEYHLLLRWKNHKGVLLPAYQISYKIK
jgi:hypothetical protein